MIPYIDRDIIYTSTIRLASKDYASENWKNMFKRKILYLSVLDDSRSFFKEMLGDKPEVTSDPYQLTYHSYLRSEVGRY